MFWFDTSFFLCILSKRDNLTIDFTIISLVRFYSGSLMSRISSFRRVAARAVVNNAVYIGVANSREGGGWEPEGGSCSRMTSDREDRGVRRGHAWAREAQDFAPRHAQDPLPPRSLSSPLHLSPFLLLPTLEGVPRALLAPSRHVFCAIGWCHARVQFCLYIAWCVALSGGWRDEQWLLRGIHDPSLAFSSRKPPGSAYDL